MISSIQGTLVAAAPLLAVVEVNGLGYEVNIPLPTAERLPATIELTLFGLLVSLGIGIPLGAAAARRRGTSTPR